ncbi:MAG: hypothetical protein VB137_14495 [Burkholderia sp.]
MSLRVPRKLSIAAARSPPLSEPGVDGSNNGANSPLAGIVASLKSRQTDLLEVKLKEAVHRVGELTMEVEMLRMERERQERRPLSVRSSST